MTVWDGERPRVQIDDSETWPLDGDLKPHRDLFYRFTDSCRNIGFVIAAQLMSSPDDVLITLDDDVEPCHHVNQWVPAGHDPIQAHLDALNRRVPISWMNTAHDTDLYLRGVPYGVRDEAPVMLSHGVWVGVPDFDGETQLRLEAETAGDYIRPDGSKIGHRLPYSLPYYVGPVPKGVLFPMCGMNLAVKRGAIPYLYFAPMGPDTGITKTEYINKTGREIKKHEFVTQDMVEAKQVPLLNRFSDIWCGVFLKRHFDHIGWACVTGYSTILHTRASDARKNFEQEKLGREWNEVLYEGQGSYSPEYNNYMVSYAQKREQFRNLIQGIIEKGGGK